ncbi:MAG TPA: beta-L-arabinofuranosidase domain-containing protein [Flavitalea sp.]|nr:beta-L-arabinofuranosidase domain-containing protein [Flavitalea sp.]
MLARRKFIRNTGIAGAGFLFIPSDIYTTGENPYRKDAVQDYLKVSDTATMNDYIGKKLDLSYRNRILAQEVDALVEPFRNRTETHLWQSEFWGKWFTSAVLAYKYRPNPELRNILEIATKKLIATQTPDGYIGNYKKESSLAQWDIWGMKYCLLGLLDYYDLTNDKASLDVAVRLANYLIKEINDKGGIIVTKGNYRGMAASSVLEPIVRLYARTKNEKYLSFAEEIVRQWEAGDGPALISKSSLDVSKRFPKPKSWYSWEQGQKAYEMMSCYEGLLELYRVTGNNRYKDAVEKTWQNIRDTEINIAGSGASEEMWFEGKKRQAQPVTHFQETCVTVTWIKLNQQLFRLSGDSKYADEIERSYYNALLGAMSPDASDWAKYTPLNGQRLPGSGQCGMDLNCCVASGPRGQFTLPLTAVMTMQQGVSVNFFVDGTYGLKSPKGRKITLIQKTDYPVSGNIIIELQLEKGEEMLVRVRIPSWSVRNKVTINGKEASGIIPGTYLKIKKLWSSNDRIEVEFDMRGRIAKLGDDEGKYIAISRGPVVFARESGVGGPPLNTVNKPVIDNEGFLQMKKVERNKIDEYQMVYSALFIPEAYTEAAAKPIPIELVDYASAGNGKEKTTFQVWMPQLYSGR